MTSLLALQRFLHARWAVAWWVIRHDSTAFTEALSGFALLLLRGAILIGLKPAIPPADVTDLLRANWITPDRWATYLMCCGAAQIILAGSRHSTLRLSLKLSIILAFVSVLVAYFWAGQADRPVVVSLLCIVAFYFGLLIRVFADRRRGVLSLEERHAAAL